MESSDPSVLLNHASNELKPVMHHNFVPKKKQNSATNEAHVSCVDSRAEL